MRLVLRGSSPTPAVGDVEQRVEDEAKNRKVELVAPVVLEEANPLAVDKDDAVAPTGAGDLDPLELSTSLSSLITLFRAGVGRTRPRSRNKTGGDFAGQLAVRVDSGPAQPDRRLS